MKKLISILIFVLCVSVQAKVLSKKQEDLPKGIKLTSGSLAQLANYQKKKKKDINEPFKAEFICYKNNEKAMIKSDITCKLERIKFVE